MGARGGADNDGATTDAGHAPAPLLAAVLDAIGARVAVIDPTGRVVITNRAWAEGAPGVAGVSCATGVDLLAALRAAGTATEDAEALARAIADVLAGNDAEHARVMPSSGDDEVQWDLVVVRELESGGQRYVVLSCTDVTERVQAGQALRRSEEELRRYRGHLEELVAARTGELETANQQLSREVMDRRRAEQALAESQRIFRTLSEQTSVALMINRADQLLYANAGASELSGYPLDELRGISLWDLVLEPYRSVARERSEARLRGEDVPARLEVPIRTKDGVERWIEISAAPVDFGGQGASLCTMFDISDRKRAEAERQQLAAQMLHAQKLESLGMLAGGIAHDFNNLLVSMLGNASLALEALPPDAPALYSVTQIERAAVRAAELTNQLLAYAGKGTLRREAVDCSALVTEMAQLLETAIGRRGRLVLGGDGPVPAIEADPTQLRQVVMNLITNAAEALPEGGGTITVQTGRTEVTAETLASAVVGDAAIPGAYVFVDVADTGRGFDAATRARVFDPFFTTKATGHGLGLAAVLGIVRNHGGAVLVQSTPGSGTSFRVLLPLEASTPGDGVRSADAAGGWRGEGLVLVVDDEVEVREVAEAMLRRRGLDVRTAGDGLQAVAALRELGTRVVCVLLDLEMPNLGGEAAFHAIREVAPTVPVVISTGYAEHASLARIRQDGRTSLLPKPYSAGQLAAAVRHALARA